jgi:putative aldouronate transport system permease protein
MKKGLTGILYPQAGREAAKLPVLIHDLWRQRFFHIWALVGTLYIFLMSYASVFGLIIAFKNYRIAEGFSGMFTSSWAGFKHFKDFFLDANFFRLLRNTLVLSGLKLLVSFTLPVALAIFISETRFGRLKRFTQTASYLPHFISWVVTATLIQVFFSSSDSGFINSVLLNIGVPGAPVNFLTNPSMFWVIAVLSDAWKETGWWAIIFIAAISSIDPGLYEAAAIDGAGRWARIRHIVLPGISTSIGVVLIISIGNIFSGGMSGSNFDQSFLIGNPMILNTSEIIPTYVYKMGFLAGRYSYAAAIGLFQSLISLIFVFTANYISSHIQGNNEGYLL